jgi:hypothetical protein
VKGILSAGVVERDPPDTIFNPALYQLCFHAQLPFFLLFPSSLLFTAETQSSQRKISLIKNFALSAPLAKPRGARCKLGR